ncbi:hypothetical protein GP486_003352 [Trichoglossum hirsutum]|uniref:Phosphoglycerate mutase family protein n=1 Tax=Trichoglossum hirsutum TaxID=265104 RepID=A0A9P8LDF8_9PEZI|nr:hypothetical protein GP486_003352 [Trichoglossum hirsutum]
MVLEVIYVVRHAFRTNWAVDPETGVYTASILSPTNIPSDAPLTSYGVEQSKQLADHLARLQPPIDRIYSSPFYRCLQTLEPYIKENGMEIRGETGIGEWYGAALFDHPSPASTSALRQLFPTYSESYIPAIIPSPSGESIEQLYDRTAYALAHMIAQLDAEEGQPKAILLCTHAATLVAAGRILTGHLPEHAEEEDFKPFTCSLSKFTRRRESSDNIEFTGTVGPDEERPKFDWRKGRGIGGGWDCVMNGDCSFLKGGAQRGW